jgi:ribonucleoside-diphosphate reductase alpha chain
MTARWRFQNGRLTKRFSFLVGKDLKYIATISRFADGGLTEIFVSKSKNGSGSGTAARDSAVVLSIAVQHGVPLNMRRRALLWDSQGRASGPLNAAHDIIGART